ncbi:MAG: M48 family metalloprotease [Gemmatimonadetes bacterium]|nr:M48 family metalloprotease [Gemmatimonadota bacterium]
MPRFSIRSFRTTLGAMVISALIAFACASSGVNKGDFNLVSYQEEWALGAQLEKDIARQLPLVNDRTALAYVNRIGQRLVNQSELAQAPWEFHIVADPQINAFNIPGGHVYVNSGLIGAADNVAELAGVMAHEISHGVARHGTEQLSKAYGFNIIAGLALGANPPIYQQILAQLVGAGTFARFGRDAEREADDLGVIYMYNAGYDPHGMVTMFQELLSRQQRSPSSVEAFFSSHPLTEDRIGSVQAKIAQLPPKGNLVLRDGEFQQIQQRVAR